MVMEWTGDMRSICTANYSFFIADLDNGDKEDQIGLGGDLEA